MAQRLDIGLRVRVPWGLNEDREGVIVDVWGDPADPSQVRVKFDPLADDDETVILLLGPSIVTPVPAART